MKDLLERVSKIEDTDEDSGLLEFVAKTDDGNIASPLSRTPGHFETITPVATSSPSPRVFQLNTTLALQPSTYVEARQVQLNTTPVLHPSSWYH